MLITVSRSGTAAYNPRPPPSCTCRLLANQSRHGWVAVIVAAHRSERLSAPDARLPVLQVRRGRQIAIDVVSMASHDRILRTSAGTPTAATNARSHPYLTPVRARSCRGSRGGQGDGLADDSARALRRSGLNQLAGPSQTSRLRTCGILLGAQPIRAPLCPSREVWQGRVDESQ